VDAGSRVQAGQALLALSAPDIQARLSQAKAGVAQAQAHLTQVSRDYERYRRLLAEGAVSPREFEALEASFKAAQAAAAQAQGQVQEAVAVKDYTVLTAPRHGVIADRRAAVGDLAHPGQTLLTLYDPAELLIEGEVNDDYRGFLAAGTRVRLEIPAVGWHGEAVLQEIFPISASASRTFKVRTAIIAGEPAASPSAGPALVPGLFARLYLPLGQSLGFLIPQTALRQVGQLTMVEVIHDGRPSLRQIKPGRRLGDQVEVLSGLAPGEQVVLP
jgi:RND family efflux transporter MFP subunit